MWRASTCWTAYLRKHETRRPGQRWCWRWLILTWGREETSLRTTSSPHLTSPKHCSPNKNCLVGTVNKSRQELPPSAKEQMELFSTQVLKCENATLTIYQGKQWKNVCLISTMHPTVAKRRSMRRLPTTMQWTYIFFSCCVYIDSLYLHWHCFV